jgi:lipoprotein-releasing system permease protein
MTTMPDTKPFAAFERTLAFRYLRARRREGFISVISLFSFLGIMLGVATLIVVLSVFNGFRHELLSKVLGFSGHASVYRADVEPIVGYEQVATRIAAVPGVKSVMPIIEGQAMVSAKSATGALVRGIAEADVKNTDGLVNENLSTGIEIKGTPDFPASFKGWDKSGGIAIGERMAWKQHLGLGSTITLISPNGPDTVVGNTPTIQDYPVVAVFKMGMSEYDEGVVYLPLAEAQAFFAIDQGVSGLEIRVDDPDNIAGLSQALRDAAGPGLLLQTWKDKNQAFFSALQVERNVTTIVMSLVILVAALNIISGLIMLVKDKGSNIAILRTMGATSGAIMRIFFMTGAAIGLAGTLAGLVAGLLFCWNIENIRYFVQWLTSTDVFNQDLYFLSKLPAILDPWQTLTVVLGSLLLAFLATLYPAWKAAKLDPVEALRYT